MTTGLIFNIQKFSLHDGPGIRSTVFMKGCPLKCAWCHNIESQSFTKELEFNVEDCTGCSACTSACPEGAIAIDSGKATTDTAICTLCDTCTIDCPQHGRHICGREVGVDELMTELLKDKVFYDQSGGGVTFSGGEALSQIDFVAEAVTACKASGLHVTIDTCGHLPWSSFERILDHADLFLYDLKLIDPVRHRQYTGVTNETIIDNLRRLSEMGKAIDIRMPVIPGINDDADNIEATITLLKEISFGTLHLLPYHNLGRGKAERFNIEYPLPDLAAPTADEMAAIEKRFTGSGFQVQTGG